MIELNAAVRNSSKAVRIEYSDTHFAVLVQKIICLSTWKPDSASDPLKVPCVRKSKETECVP